MDSTKRRMIAVAVLVTGFAVGMAGLLNYYKYRSTALGLVQDRLLVTGRSIEGSIQGSLALGLQFGDIGTLPGTLQREQATDDLILSIDIFSTDGKMLYSTDRLRMSRPVPPAWLEAARKAGKEDWFVAGDDDAAAGMTIDNNFGLTLGHVVLRYSSERVEQAIHQVGRELALTSLGIFAMAALLASAALLQVMNRLGREVGDIEGALKISESGNLAPRPRGPFGPVMARFIDTVRSAEGRIAELRAELHRGTR